MTFRIPDFRGRLIAENRSLKADRRLGFDERRGTYGDF